MKNYFKLVSLCAGLVSLACGCNKSESARPVADGDTPKAPSAASTALVETVKSTVTDLAAKFVEQANSAADKQLGSIASELNAKQQALKSAVGPNEAMKGKLDSTLQSLISGQDSGALSSAFDLVKAANLTPQQLGLAKEVGNLAAAFVVQKDFASLEGAQGDVAAIVGSLRKGDIIAAVPALKNVATNSHLTDSQKRIITAVADKYAPGWQTAASAVDALKKLPGF